MYRLVCRERLLQLCSRVRSDHFGFLQGFQQAREDIRVRRPQVVVLLAMGLLVVRLALGEGSCQQIGVRWADERVENDSLDVALARLEGDHGAHQCEYQFFWLPMKSALRAPPPLLPPFCLPRAGDLPPPLLSSPLSP